MRELLSLEETRATPLLKGPYVSVSLGLRPGRTLLELAAEGVVHPALAGLAPFPSAWAHQEAAIRSIRAGRTTGAGRREFTPLEVEDDFDGCVRVIAELLEVLPAGA